MPEDRQAALKLLRAAVLKSLPKGYEEGIQYGMIGYFVPHSIYPAGYHCDRTQPLPFAQIASPKNHMAIYLFCLYTDPKLEEWFRGEWAKTGLRLDMGKSCIRFKKIEQVPVDLICNVIRKMSIKKFIRSYEEGCGISSQQPNDAGVKSASSKTAKRSKTPAKSVTKGTLKKRPSSAKGTRKIATKSAQGSKAVKKSPA